MEDFIWTLFWVLVSLIALDHIFLEGKFTDAFLNKFSRRSSNINLKKIKKEFDKVYEMQDKADEFYVKLEEKHKNLIKKFDDLGEEILNYDGKNEKELIEKLNNLTIESKKEQEQFEMENKEFQKEIEKIRRDKNV